MAEHGDMKAHVSTYNGVMKFLYWGAIACFIVAAGVVWLIAN
ncbi:aa3-type cytochrome c oxidase subunit IV [Sphingomonas floccifaciens]|uniref:Aa3-type cytochrome c oxidase subunit IV n=1 Tax=Sphingomonas floccifaciens TaxID=1844115 RepID=A0ABW4NC70_9SPHN